MLRSLSLLLVAAWSTTLWSAVQVPVPNTANPNSTTGANMRPKLASNSHQPNGRNLTTFGVETKNRQRPVNVEQDCPSPDLVDYVKTTSWNNLEAGVSFPIGEGVDARLYTRYTCQAPKTEPY
jgi:hypothetical protein